METVSPYKVVRSDDVEPGQLILLEVDRKLTSAFAVLYKNKDVGFLVLEGMNIGTVEYRDNERVLLFNGPLRLQLPAHSDGWRGEARPAGSLAVAYHNDEGFFVYRRYEQDIAVNIGSGEVGDLPHRLIYLRDWAIYSDPLKEPILRSVNPM